METLKHKMQSSIIVSNLNLESFSKCIIRLGDLRCLTEIKQKHFYISWEDPQKDFQSV